MEIIQGKIAELREKGWTLQTLAGELGVHRETVYEWGAGNHDPANPKPVLAVFDALLRRRRIPKQRRYAKGSRQKPDTGTR